MYLGRLAHRTATPSRRKVPRIGFADSQDDTIELTFLNAVKNAGVRFKLNLKRCAWAEIFVPPQIARRMRGFCNSEISPLQLKLFRGLSEIRNSNVAFSWFFAVCYPSADIPAIQHLMPAMAVLIHVNHVFVGEQSRCVGIIARQVAP